MMLTYDDLFRLFFDSMKPREQWRVGAEAEKFGVHVVTGAPVAYEGDSGVAGIMQSLAARFGWSMAAELEGGPLISLSRGRAQVTLEPGAQLELSGAPLDDMHSIVAETQQHIDELSAICEPLGIAWLAIGFHPFARQDELPWVPKQRYSVMREYLPTRGVRALDMMRRTATVQANFDYASEEDAMRKLRLALRLSPIVTAMFANSPLCERRATGGRTERARVWLAVDPDRQGLLPKLWRPAARLADYVEWALDAPMFLFKREHHAVRNTGQTFRSFMERGFEGHVATLADWELHLNTLFPEVRLKHTLEVRGADSVPRRFAAALPALWTGILYDDKALTEAERLSESWTFEEMEALRPAVAEKALAATLRSVPIAEPARALLDIAAGGLRRRARYDRSGADESVHLASLGALVAAGRAPADDLLRDLPSEPAALVREVIERGRA
jgi:glutamate--cysteine ligase